MYRWLAVLLVLMGTGAAQAQQAGAPGPASDTASPKNGPEKMHMMQPDDMFYCHLVAQEAQKSEQVGLMSAEDYEQIVQLTRIAKGIQMLDQIGDATFRGLADYVANETWNVGKLKNQEAIAATDNRDIVARERFLTACLINIANLGMGTAEAYRRKLLYDR